MYEIEISNQQTNLPIDESMILDVAQTVFKTEQVQAAQLSVVFVNNSTMRELNVRHLDHDYDTDVLSFLLECYDDASAPVHPELRGSGKSLEGEVIISAEMACQCAGEFDWSSENELILYLVHGLLHLVGYDDLSESERELMRSRERSILQTWNLSPHYANDSHESLADEEAASGESTGEPPSPGQSPRAVEGDA